MIIFTRSYFLYLCRVCFDFVTSFWVMTSGSYSRHSSSSIIVFLLCPWNILFNKQDSLVMLKYGRKIGCSRTCFFLFLFFCFLFVFVLFFFFVYEWASICTLYKYNENVYGKCVKETTPPRLKYQPKATHWYSMKEEETLKPQGRLQLAPKTTFYTDRFSERVASMYLSNINIK